MRYEITILFGPCDQQDAEEFLEDIADEFGDDWGAVYALREFDEASA